MVGTFYDGVPAIDNSRGYVTLRNAQTLLGRPDIVGRIEIRLADPEAADRRTPSACERMFGYDAESWQETNANFLGLFAMQDIITAFVIGAILLVGGFGILAIQIMIVLAEDARHRHPAQRRASAARHPPRSSSCRA